MARTPARKTKDKTPLVWRFVDYESRWGNNGCGDKVPQYLKWYINGWDGVGGQVLVALNRLRAEDNFIWLQGALVELLTVATQTDKQCQGWLLNSRKCPATASEIGRMLRVDGRGVHASALAVLETLSKAGILEQTPWSPVDLSGDILDKPTPPLKDVTTSKTDACPAKKPRSQPKKAAKPLKEKSKSKGKEKINREGQAEAKGKTQGLAAPAEPGPRLEPRREGETEAQFWARRKAELAAQLQGDSTSAPPTTPAIREAISATKRDAGGPCHQSSRMAPRVDSPQPIANIIQFHRLNPERYSQEAWRVADAIIEAVGYQAPSPGEMANERARWAKAWDEAVGVVRCDLVHQLEGKLMAKARYVRSRRNNFSRPEAYLRTAMTNLVRDAIRTQKGATA